MEQETTLRAEELTAEEVVQRYSQAVYALALNQTRCRADAEDVFQEVFLLYVQKAPPFASEEHRKSWLLRVTINCCKKLWRWKSRHKTVALEEALTLETRDQIALAAALDKLPEKHRAAVHLFYFQGLSTQEIARVTGSSPGAVRTRLNRARVLLRQELGEDDL